MVAVPVLQVQLVAVPVVQLVVVAVAVVQVGRACASPPSARGALVPTTGSPGLSLVVQTLAKQQCHIINRLLTHYKFAEA